MGVGSISPRWLVSAAAALSILGTAQANPRGGQVVGGSATIQGQGTPGVVINQSSQSAIINWQSFNIGSGEATQFVQPNAAAVALNRVAGDKNPSTIFGTLSANGRVFLVNPEGFIFGPDAKINTAGFLATTHDIRNEDFLAGKYLFNIAGNPSASIVNQGTITVADTGIAALVAPAVRNDGIITARLGKVALGSGNGFTLDLYGDNLITFALNDAIASQVIDVASGKPVKSLVENKGKLSADGGVVAMTAVTARALVDSVINNSGVVEARSVGLQNGRIVLGAQTAKSKTAGAPTQKIAVSGRLDASGKNAREKGGTVQVTGESIALAGATIDASGSEGGGKVLIGGDTSGGGNNPAIASNALAAHEGYAIPTATSTSVDAATTINASALAAGNGGKVIVWSDDTTGFAGTVIARGSGANGNGGFVEVSGRNKLAFGGLVDLGAPAGRPGTLLLDPKDVTIGDSGTWIVTPSAIQTALASGDVIVNTSAAGTDAGDITVAQNVSWGSGSTLTLSANRDINVLSGVTIANTSAGSLALRADNAGSGVGTVTFAGTGKVDFSSSTGTVSIFYNPAGGYTSPTNYPTHALTNGAVSSQLTAYMLVNNVINLQNVQQNLGGAFALGKNIDASATASWNAGAGFIPIGRAYTATEELVVRTAKLDELSGGPPVTDLYPITTPFFYGVFDGQNHVISGLTINSGASEVGMFGSVGSTLGGSVVGRGIVRNAVLASANITGVANGSRVGGIAGLNGGLVAHSFVDGTVAGSNQLASVGGAVGTNVGTVTMAGASATVRGTGSSASVGGLVGLNDGGAISLSYATGPVSAFTYGRAGGLVGQITNGDISQSYATGSVTAGLSADAGGLVGLAAGKPFFSSTIPATITASYATGPSDSVQAPTVTPALEGGLIAENKGAIITNSYWDTQTTGHAGNGPTTAPGVDNSIGMTTSQLQSGLPSGFSSSVWKSDGGYPRLTWQTATTPIATVFTGAGPAPITLYYVATPQTDVYGHPLPVLTGTITDVSGNPAPAGSTSGTLSFSTAATTSSNIGAYSITGYGLTVVGNYALQQAPGNATALTISPAPLTITANDATKPVGQSNPTFSASYSGFVLGQNSGIVSGLTLTTPGTASSPAGNYSIVPSGASAPNYTISYINGVLTITPISPNISQVAAAAASNALGTLWESIKVALPIPWFFSTQYKLANASVTITDFLLTVSKRNRAIMDDTIKGWCGNGTCSESAISQAADDLSNMPFMGATNIKSSISVAKMTQEQYLEYVRQITAERAKQLGYVIQ